MTADILLEEQRVRVEGELFATKATIAILDGNFLGRSSLALISKELVVNDDKTGTGGKLFFYEGGENFSLNPDYSFKNFNIACNFISVGAGKVRVTASGVSAGDKAQLGEGGMTIRDKAPPLGPVPPQGCSTLPGRPC